MDEKKAEIVFPSPWEYRVFSVTAQADDVEKGMRGIVEAMKLSDVPIILSTFNNYNVYHKQDT